MEPGQTTILSGRVVTMDGARRILDDGAVAFDEAGTIVSVGGRADVLAAYPEAREHAPADAIILPGLIDGHTHASQALVRGLIAHELPMILRIYAPATGSMDAVETGLAARLCMSQLLRSGVTTVCEGALGQSDDRVDATVEAALATGIRCNIVRGVGDQDFHHAALYAQNRDRSWLRVREGEAEADLARTEALLARFPAGSRGKITAGVCASSLTGYSERYFVEAARLAERADAKLHIHAARDREEVEFCLSVFGGRPIEKLAELGVLNGRAVLAHAMLATEAEIVSMAQARCGVAHSSIECLNILNAVPNVRLMRELGITVGLGCDNAVNDMFEVMRGTWLIHAATRGIANYDPEILTAHDILAMATIDGARMLGLEEVTGSIEIGKEADLIVLDGSAPHLLPTQDLVSEIVRYATRAEVRQVFVSGQEVVRDGTVVSFNMHELEPTLTLAAQRASQRVAGKRYRSACACAL